MIVNSAIIARLQVHSLSSQLLIKFLYKPPENAIIVDSYNRFPKLNKMRLYS